MERMAEPRLAPTPPSFRPRGGPKRPRKDGVLGLVPRVQHRDLHILLDIYDKKVLTTHQIRDIYFISSRRARDRLLLLYRSGILNRFRPLANQGSLPDHYVLGKAGAEIVAAYLGRELKDVYDKDQITKLAYSPFLPHLVAVNTFYSRLAWACRRRENHNLEWWGELRTRRRWRNVVADGFGRIDTPGRTRSFLLELDMGTEPLRRLAGKHAGYHMVSRGDSPPDVLLFCFPTPAREANARKVLQPIGMQVATTWLDLHKADALSENWLPLQAERRYSLLEVP
jgi:hypothetical protein